MNLLSLYCFTLSLYLGFRLENSAFTPPLFHSMISELHSPPGFFTFSLSYSLAGTRPGNFLCYRIRFRLS